MNLLLKTQGTFFGNPKLQYQQRHFFHRISSDQLITLYLVIIGGEMGRGGGWWEFVCGVWDGDGFLEAMVCHGGGMPSACLWMQGWG